MAHADDLPDPLSPVALEPADPTLSPVPPSALDGAGPPSRDLAAELAALRAENEVLRRSERRLQRLVANVPGMVYQFTLRPDGSVAFPYVSEGSRELTGLEPHLFLSQPERVLGLIHPEDRPGFDQAVADSAASLRPTQWEGRIVLESGEERWIRFASRPERQAGGDVVWAGLLMDVTARRRAEEALRESEARFHAFMDNSPAMAFLKDEQERLVYFNRPAARCYGLLADSLGKTVFDLYPAETAAPLRAHDRAVLETGRLLEVLETVPTVDGAVREWLTYKFPVTDGAGRRFIGGMAVDVTERRRAERVLRVQEAALTRMLSTLMTETDLDAFLGQALAAIAEAVGVRGACLWLFDSGQDAPALQIACEDGRILSAAALDARAAPGPSLLRRSPLWKEAVRTRRPLVVTDFALDPRVPDRESWLALGARSGLLAPLLEDHELSGWLSITDAEPREYPEEEIELAQALARQVTLALQLTRLAEKGRQAAVLGERNRMAREIHDTLAQGFTGILLQLEAADAALDEEPAAARPHLDRARGLAQESLAEARRSVWALRSPALEEDGLALALAGLARQMTQGTSVTAETHVRGTPRALPAGVEADLLRIGLEALTNALRHGHCRSVRIELGFEAAEVWLSVRDDGRGFDPRQAAEAGGLGLVGMYERAGHLSARLEVVSRPGAGALVAVTVPSPAVPPEPAGGAARR